MKQIENLAPLFFPMFLYWPIFWGFLKIASDVFFPRMYFFLVYTVMSIDLRGLFYGQTS